MKIRVSRVVWLLTAAFYLLFPFSRFLGISATKDTIFGCLFSSVFVCVCDMVSEKRVYREGALFLAALILMELFRNNAVYGLCFTILCLIVAYAVMRLHARKNMEFLLQLSLVFQFP